jgi:hypothetical protein
MLETAGAREEQRKLDYERSQQKTLAEQHLEDMASGKGKGKADSDVNQNFAKGRLGESDEVSLDKERLRAAIAAEKKRKGVTDEDEAWNQAKRSKTDVTEEDMGAFFALMSCLRELTSVFFHRGLPTHADSCVRRPHGELPRRRVMISINLDVFFSRLQATLCRPESIKLYSALLCINIRQPFSFGEPHLSSR